MPRQEQSTLMVIGILQRVKVGLSQAFLQQQGEKVTNKSKFKIL